MLSSTTLCHSEVFTRCGSKNFYPQLGCLLLALLSITPGQLFFPLQTLNICLFVDGKLIPAFIGVLVVLSFIYLLLICLFIDKMLKCESFKGSICLADDAAELLGSWNLEPWNLCSGSIKLIESGQC